MLYSIQSIARFSIKGFPSDRIKFSPPLEVVTSPDCAGTFLVLNKSKEVLI